MPDVSFTELAGRRVVLRRFRSADVAEFAAYRSDAEVARYQSWDAPYPPERGERFVAQMMTAHPDTPGEWFQFALGLRAGWGPPCRVACRAARVPVKGSGDGRFGDARDDTV